MSQLHRTLRLVLTALFLAVLLVPATLLASDAAEKVNPNDAFDRIKSLEGTWKGAQPEGASPEHKSQVDYRVTAAGHTVLSTMMPGTEHEMVNAFYLDGDDLVLTHYCAGGNQPRMKFDPETSTADHYRFKFNGGSNLEGADHYIDSADLQFEEDGGLTEDWHSGDNTISFTMKRDG